MKDEETSENPAPESLADIVRELRHDAEVVMERHDEDTWSGFEAAGIYRDLADRIEAAEKRELSRAAEDAASKATLDRTAKDAAEYLAYAMAHNSAPQGPASAAPAAEPLAAILADYRADIPAMTSGELPHPTPEYLRILLDRIEAAAVHERSVDENTSDGYHTFRELYRYRMLYNAAFFNMLSRHTGIAVVKSRRHGDGEPCFGGGWFIVMAQLPTGQISNHYEDRYWGLFCVPEVDMAPKWDGHTPNDAADRLESFLEMREPDSDRSNPPGNAAAMREALEALVNGADCFRGLVIDSGVLNGDAPLIHRAKMLALDMSAQFGNARAALAAPARNCDKYSLDDIKKMDRDFGAFCKQFGAKNGENCSGCPIKPMDNLCCHSTWMLLPAAEGGEEC